ncbi:MAG TPA: VCBS repeat-containing protein [Steroidobacteraceae bacterium]|nr:VCBS repeat-containing protein [Steroidobacteraceae bacterium]
MRGTLGRYRSLCAVLATGIGVAALAGCGNSNFYNITQPQSVVIADFAGTGYPGVAVAQAQIDESGVNPGEQPGYVAVVLQTPGSPGTFGSSTHFGTKGNPFAMVAGDLTNSGAVDLAVANGNDQSISVLMETAPKSATFSPALNVPTSPAGLTTTPDDVAMCDINGDGFLDLVVADAGAAIDPATITTYSAIGAVTTNGHIIGILQNASSPGTFGAPTVIGPAPTPAADESPTPTANAIYGVACGSLSTTTAGAPPDIVFTSYDYQGDNGTVSILFHDPAHPGQFLPRFDLSLPGLLHRVVIADVNNDGLPDIIVANAGAGSDGNGTAGIVVMLQDPSNPGTFEAPVTYAVYAVSGFAVGDVNGDGLPDIVSASSYPPGTGTVSVQFNDASVPGTFSATPVEYSGLGNPEAVAIGPLSGHTLNDIATADSTGVAVMLNETSSPGTFGAPALVGG